MDHNGATADGNAAVSAADQIVRSSNLDLKCPVNSSKASSTAAVSGQWLALATGATQYTLAATQAAATKFFVNQYTATSTYAFHNADDTRQVALQGQNGALLYVVDATNPNASTIPAGQLMEWATFTMDSNVLGVKDGSTLTNRTFVAVQGTGTTYQVALYDGELMDEAFLRYKLTDSGTSNTTAKLTSIILNIVKA